MILLLTLFAGLLAGMGVARWRNQNYAAPELKSTWLVAIGFLPQLFIAYLPVTHPLFDDSLASLSLLVSTVMFLIFAWINRQVPGMSILIIGLLLNFIVIVANGGWMPISLDTAGLLTGKAPMSLTALGARFGEKDILLLEKDIHFEFLSDRFIVPDWFPYKTAFSLGDILIGAGVFWLLATPNAKINLSRKEGVVI